MKGLRFLAISLVVLLFVLAHFCTPAAAQISTNTPSATVTPQATAAATEPAVVVVAPTPVEAEPVTSSPADGTMSIWVTLILIVITAITSGLAGGVGAARMLVSGLEKVNQNPALIATMETAIDGLRTSAPVNDILRAVSLGAQIATKITDGIPESAKTPSANEGPLSDDMRERLHTEGGSQRTAQGYTPATGFEENTARVDKEGRVTVEGARKLGVVPPSFLFEPKDVPPSDYAEGTSAPRGKPDDTGTEPKQPETAEGGA